MVRVEGTTEIDLRVRTHSIQISKPFAPLDYRSRGGGRRHTGPQPGPALWTERHLEHTTKQNKHPTFLTIQPVGPVGHESGYLPDVLRTHPRLGDIQHIQPLRMKQCLNVGPLVINTMHVPSGQPERRSTRGQSQRPHGWKGRILDVLDR